MGNNPVSGFDPDGGWSWLGAAVRYLGALGTGQNPSGFGQRSDGEWGFYTSLGGNSSETASVMGGANFERGGTSAHIARMGQIANSWVLGDLGLFSHNTITKEVILHKRSDGIEPVYIESNFIGGPISAGKVGWQALSLAAKVSRSTSKIEQISSSIGLKYSPTKKHQKGGFGTEMDLDDITAATVLNKSTLGGKQRYSYHNGKLYEFQPDNVGGWHGYPIKGTEAPPSFLKSIRDNKSITNSEYNRLIKGK